MTSWLLVSGDFVKSGGMDRANYALAAHLAARGDDLHLVAFRAAEDLLAHPNVTLHAVPKPLGSYLIGAPLLDRAGRRWGATIAGRGGRVVVNGGNCLWGDVNWVHHVHASDAPQAFGGPFRRAKMNLVYRRWAAEERRAVARARLVLTTCEKNRRDLVERLGVAEAKIRTVPYGIDADAFRPAEPEERPALRQRLGWAADRPVLTFVGSLASRRKGFDVLYHAWRSCAADPGWDAELVVIGGGAELPDWKARAAAEGLDHAIHFLGFRRDVPDLMRACDGHCLPSRYEGYSLVTQEALACGVPAFVTRASGIAERYPADLVELLIDDPEDVALLAGKLRAWRPRVAALRDLVAPFSQQIRALSWDAMAAQLVAAIE